MVGKKKNVNIALAQMLFVLINVTTVLSVFQTREKWCMLKMKALCLVHTGMF